MTCYASSVPIIKSLVKVPEKSFVGHFLTLCLENFEVCDSGFTVSLTIIKCTIKFSLIKLLLLLHVDIERVHGAVTNVLTVA